MLPFLTKGFFLLVGVVLLCFYWVNDVLAAPPAIQNVSQSSNSVGRFKKIEWKFNLSTNYPNPYYFYNPQDTPANNPSNATWTGEDGVTVDMHLTDPSGKALTVPAFWYEDYTRTQGPMEVLGKVSNGDWRVRFAPSDPGEYRYYITAQDSQGTSRYPSSGTLSFTVTNSQDKGFIRTSATDSRFMEYTNGASYVPIASGRQWWENGSQRSYEFEEAFETFGENGVNLVRIWDSADFALGVEGAQPVWIRQGFSNPGAAAGTEIGSSNVRSGLRAARPSTDQGWYQRIALSQPNTEHKLHVWIKGINVAGGQVNVRTGTLYNSGTLVGQITPNTGTSQYTQYSVTFTPGSGIVNVNLIPPTSGTMYIDDISFGPVDASGNIVHNTISDPDFERHFAKDATGNDPNSNPNLPRPLGNYFNQWSSYELDKIVEAAETSGVAIQLCSCSGPWFTWPENPDIQDYSAHWSLETWKRNFRYHVARWGYSPAILAWEKHNEHGHVPVGSGLYNFYQQYGQYQAATDPYHHLRTTSQGSQAYSPGLWSSQGFDLANYHDYQMISRYPAELTNDSANFVYRFAWCLRNPGTSYCNGLAGDGSVWSGAQKPWVWGEIGVGTQVFDQPNTQGTQGEGGRRALRNQMWAGLFSPLGTTPIEWYWEQEDQFATDAKFAERKIASDFFANIDYDGAVFAYMPTTQDAPPGYSGETVTSSNSTARVYAMRRQDKKAAYAWVQHRDSTWSKSSTTPSAISSTVTIGNLLNSDTYKIEVWNTSTGAIISSTQKNPSSGSISFAINNLTSDVAVKIESTTLPSVTPQPGATEDQNNDGKVNIFDSVFLIVNFNSTSYPKGDLNGNGEIDAGDIVQLLQSL